MKEFINNKETKVIIINNTRLPTFGYLMVFGNIYITDAYQTVPQRKITNWHLWQNGSFSILYVAATFKNSQEKSF